jgi:hypothetical protein
MARKTNYIVALVLLLSWIPSAYPRELNYNYISDTNETVVEPFIWKNSVASAAALLAIVSPVDGEARKVLDTNEIYQYNVKRTTWVLLTKSPFSFSKKSFFFFDTQLDSTLKSEIDTMQDGIFSIRPDGDISPTLISIVTEHFTTDNQGDITTEVSYE